MLWIKTPNSAHNAAFPRQRLNARFSCWHKLAVDTNISCIHSYIWEYVAMRKRLSKFHICENKRLSVVVTRTSLLIVYGDEFRVDDKILLEWPKKQNFVRFLILDPE